MNIARTVMRNLRMPVVTLNQSDFEAACQQLAQEAGRERPPALLLGIRRGGDCVATAMRGTAGLAECPYVTVTCQRTTTSGRLRVQLAPLLKRLPSWLSAWLRRLEGAWRELRFERARLKAAAGPKRQPIMSPECQTAVRRAASALIVDDAVDSGETLLAVRRAVEQLNPGIRVMSAAIVVTFAKPVQMPDICLYRDCLVRFPWSDDA